MECAERLAYMAPKLAPFQNCLSSGVIHASWKILGSWWRRAHCERGTAPSCAEEKHE